MQINFKYQKKFFIILTILLLIIAETIFSHATNDTIILDCIEKKALTINDTSIYEFNNNELVPVKELEANTIIELKSSDTIQINNSKFYNISLDDKEYFIWADDVLNDETKQDEIINAGYLWATANEGIMLYSDESCTEPMRSVNVNTNLIGKVSSIEELFIETNEILYMQKNDLGAVIDITNSTVKLFLTDGNTGYAFKENFNFFVSENQKFDIDYSKNNSETAKVRELLVKNALTYVGNKYKWGGTSLTNGTDCSGFIKSLYQLYGVSTARTAHEQAKFTRTISKEELQPGDVVYYKDGNTISHVAMYIGNDMIVHARNKKFGIRIDDINYETPYSYGTYF